MKTRLSLLLAVKV